MTGSRVETTISYKLDARGLRAARKELEKAFKPLSVKELNVALKEMRGMLKSLSGEQARLTAEMLKVERGTDAYKKLAKEIGGVEDRIRRLGGAMSSLNQGAPGHGAFGQGLLQGLSPLAGGFLQRGPGMRTQFAGQVAGGAARGAFGRVAGAFGGGASGGVLSSTFANIPGLAGAAGLAEGVAGSALDYYAARSAAMPYARGQMNAAGVAAGPAARRAAAAAGRAAQSKASVDFMASATSSARAQANAALDAAAADPSQVPGFWGKGAPGSMARKQWDAEWASMSTSQRREKYGAYYDKQIAGVARRAGNAAQGGAAAAGRAAYGPAAQAAEAAATERARMRFFSGIEGVGKSAALTRTQSLQAYAEMARITGGSPDVATFGQVQAARVAHGVDAGTSASLLRAQRAGRGGSSALGGDLLGSAIQGALVQGLEGSEINEHLEAIAAAQEQAASQGLKIQTETLQGLGVALSKGVGLAGPQAGRVAGQLQSFSQRVAMGGASGPVDLQLLRTYGFSPNGGKDSYWNAIKAAGKGMNADQAVDFMGRVAAGGHPLAFMRAMQQAGIQVSPEQAEQMFNAVQGGGGGAAKAKLSSLGLIGADGMVKTSYGTAAGLTADLGKMKGALAPQVAQAGIENNLIGVGQQTLGLVQQVQANTGQIAQAVAKFADLANKLVAQPVGVIADAAVEIAEAVTGGQAKSRTRNP